MGEEARKFFRYVLPGLVYGILTLVFLLFVLSPGPTWNVLREYGKESNLGGVVTVFFVSGGLGYIFASLHHFIYWLMWEKHSPFDHRQIALDLDRRRKIVLSREDREVIDGKNEIAARVAAQIATMSFWYLSHEANHPGKDGIDHLGNQAHGLGTTRISVMAALLTAELIVSQESEFRALGKH